MPPVAYQWVETMKRVASLLGGPRLRSVAGALLGLAVVAACSGVEAAADGHSRERFVVERGRFQPTILLTGEVVAEEAVRFVVPNANIWPVQIQWLAEDGAEIKAGSPVLSFDNSQLTADLEQRREAVLDAEERLASQRAAAASQLEEAAFGFEQAKASLAKARLDADVPAELFAAREYENRQLALHRAELELAKAEGVQRAAGSAGEADIALAAVALDKSRLAVATAERRLAALELLAPRDGVVLRHENREQALRPYEIGDSVWPGLVVASLPDLSTLLVEASLYDVDDGRVIAGQPVVAQLDAYPEQTFGGRVRSVDALAEVPAARSSRRLFRVVVDLDESDLERLRPGMSVKLEVTGEAHESVLLVPRAAIDWSAETPRVRTADGEATAVELGDCTADVCMATAGVSAGQVLVRSRP